MDIKVVDQVQESPKEIASPTGLVEEGLLLRNEIATLFDFKPNEVREYKNKLDTLIAYAKTKTDDHSPEGLRWAIRQLGIKLGTPPLTERLIEYLHRFAYLSLEGKKIEDQKQKFLRGEQE